MVPLPLGAWARGLIAFALLAACGDGASGVDAGVDTDAGCQPEPPPSALCGASTATRAVVRATRAGVVASGLPVAAHRADGSIIDQQVTDARGCATVTTEPDALVSVAYVEGCCFVNLLTTLAPTAGELVVHGWREAVTVPITASCTPLVLTLDGRTAPPTTERLYVDLGASLNACQALGESRFTHACVGSDDQLDLLVVALRMQTEGPMPTLAPVGYAGGRVSVIDGRATFAPTSWTGPETDACPARPEAALAPVLSTQCTYLTDEATFAAHVDGLQVEGVTVTAAVANRQVRTRMYRPGLPADVPLVAADFLPDLPAADVVEDAASMTLRWPTDLPAMDVVYVDVSWAVDGRSIAWHVVLPGDAVTARLPAIADPHVSPPDPATPSTYPTTAHRMYVDADQPDFRAAVAGGLYFERGAQPWLLAPRLARVRQTTGAGI